MIYKVSYVVQGGTFPGGIKNQEEEPRVGDEVKIGPVLCRIVEVLQIMPPRDNFLFLHATVVPVEEEIQKETDA